MTGQRMECGAFNWRFNIEKALAVWDVAGEGWGSGVLWAGKGYGLYPEAMGSA